MIGSKLRALGFKRYSAYLRSPHWLELRAEFAASDREQDCYCCGESKTQLHHKTYERLGAELLDDLVPLCCRCHTLVHVLERRGDLGLDLAGLLDAARAKRYAREQEEMRQRASADARAGARERRTRHVTALTRRLSHAFERDDMDAYRASLAGLQEVLETLT